MDYDFTSLKELYERIRPALRAKEVEFHRLGFSDIKGFNIWNYLIETKWKNGKGLMLSDIVSDIMNCDCRSVDSYFKSKVISEKMHSLDDGIDLL